MKILFYNHTGQVSGAERVLLSVLTGLADFSGHNATVCCPPDSPLAKAVAGVSANWQPVAELRARFTWRPDHLLLYLWSFAKVISDFRRRVVAAQPDLVYANSVRAGLVATAATFGLRVPVVWHIHDVLPNHPFSLLIRWFALLSSRTHLLAVSQATANRFQSRFFHRRPAKVIHNGVDVARFRPDPAARAAVRSELSLGVGDFAIGIIGQITPRKGQLELIRGFAHADEPNATLLIVGAPLFDHDHDYADRLHNEVERLNLTGRVRFPGARPDVPAMIQALDLAVIASHSDPFPLVMLEAMASGTPVLATAVDGIPELIDHLKTGWLVPPHDEEAMAVGIVALLHSPELRTRFSVRGAERVQKNFTAELFQLAVRRYLLEVFKQHSNPANGQGDECRSTITSEQ